MLLYGSLWRSGMQNAKSRQGVHQRIELVPLEEEVGDSGRWPESAIYEVKYRIGF